MDTLTPTQIITYGAILLAFAAALIYGIVTQRSIKGGTDAMREFNQTLLALVRPLVMSLVTQNQVQAAGSTIELLKFFTDDETDIFLDELLKKILEVAGEQEGDVVTEEAVVKALALTKLSPNYPRTINVTPANQAATRVATLKKAS